MIDRPGDLLQIAFSLLDHPQRWLLQIVKLPQLTVRVTTSNNQIGQIVQRKL